MAMRFRLLTILVITAPLAAACSPAEEATTTTTTVSSTTTTLDLDALDRYESSELRFAIDYPQGWTVTPSPAEGIVGFTAPIRSEDLAPNFNVSTGAVPEEVTAADYYAVERNRLDVNLAEMRVLEEVAVDVDGYPGRGFTLLTSQSGRDVGISRIIVLVEGRVWEVTFFAEAEELQTLSPLVSRIFRSFEILD